MSAMVLLFFFILLYQKLPEAEAVRLLSMIWTLEYGYTVLNTEINWQPEGILHLLRFWPIS